VAYFGTTTFWAIMQTTAWQENETRQRDVCLLCRGLYVGLTDCVL